MRRTGTQHKSIESTKKALVTRCARPPGAPRTRATLPRRRLLPVQAVPLETLHSSLAGSAARTRTDSSVHTQHCSWTALSERGDNSVKEQVNVPTNRRQNPSASCRTSPSASALPAQRQLLTTQPSFWRRGKRGQLSPRASYRRWLLLPAASRYFYPCIHRSLPSLPRKFETWNKMYSF